ncbi:Ig domain-containing protein [Microbacterium marinum]|nr:Ig domain-containing protein [Microbacterium marinum]
MILEAPAAITARPLTPAGGAGVAWMVVDATPDGAVAADYSSIVAAGLELIPPSIREPLERWSSRSGITRKLNIAVASNSDSSAAMAALFRLTGWSIPDGWGGRYGDRAFVQINRQKSTTIHEYAHHIDYLWRVSNGQPEGALRNEAEFTSLFAVSMLTMEEALYGHNSSAEWIAELLTKSIDINYNGARSNHPRIFLGLCGDNTAVAGHVRALLLDIFPDLPAFSWGSSWIASPPEPSITGYPLGDISVGAGVSCRLFDESGLPVTWSISADALPAGLELTDGMIHGNAVAPGPYAFTVRVSSSGGTMDRAFTGYVFDPSRPKPVITTTSLPAIIRTEPYSFQLQATSPDPITWSLPDPTRPLHAGLTLSPSGLISGTTSDGTPRTYKVRASSYGGYVDLTVNANVTARIAFTTKQLPALKVGSSVGRIAIDGTGANLEEKGLVAGALPSGLQFEFGDPSLPTFALFGIPNAAGPYSFTLRMANEYTSAEQTFTGTVSPA